LSSIFEPQLVRRLGCRNRSLARQGIPVNAKVALPFGQALIRSAGHAQASSGATVMKLLSVPSNCPDAFE